MAAGSVDRATKQPRAGEHENVDLSSYDVHRVYGIIYFMRGTIWKSLNSAWESEFNRHIDKLSCQTYKHKMVYRLGAADGALIA